MEENNQPEWVCGKRINEMKCAREYIQATNLVYSDGAFFTQDGRITDETQIRKEIYDAISPHITTNIVRRVDNIMSVLRLEAHRENFDKDTTVMHFKNGTYDLNNGFVQQKFPCRYRLPVNLNMNAPDPTKWLTFLDQLLEPADIVTLQEFMGYCLIPTTKAQKMLIITGRGGEGKSRIGVVMKSLLGDCMNVGSIAKVETNAFARADLEHILLLVDDDLKMEGLPGTNYLKSIISAELPMDLERKGKQSYQGKLHCRFMAFGNGSLQALNDRSHGFFRRQIILEAKPRPADRVDDPFLAQALQKEAEGILLWALKGLFRLIEQDFQFTVSKKASNNLRDAVLQSNNIVAFMQSEGYFIFSDDGTVTSRRLYQTYTDWCEDNMTQPLNTGAFWNYFKQEASFYGLKPSNHIPIGNGRQARGFTGIRILR